MAQNGDRQFNETAADAARSQQPQPPASLQAGTPSSAAAAAAAAALMRDQITLNQPRPDGARTRNYYTETPFKPPRSPGKSGVGGKPTEDDNANVAASSPLPPQPGAGGDGTRIARPPCSSGPAGGVVASRSRPILPLPPSRAGGLLGAVTTQPCTFKKEKSDVSLPTSISTTTTTDDEHSRDSIICRECGRCKCDACRNPRPLPTTWICGGNLECSAEAMVDLCSCMCCVKGVFYHCTKDYDVDGDGVACADKPCTCAPHRRCSRWGCLASLALVLPCLLCYWPLKGCVRVCESCYASYHSRGCRCMQRRGNNISPPCKRLLDQLDPDC